MVARICKVKPPSVSEWRRRGIPDARRQFLELLRPDVFGPKHPGASDDSGAAPITVSPPPQPSHDEGGAAVVPTREVAHA
jgi:hypothetical protein